MYKSLLFFLSVVSRYNAYLYGHRKIRKGPWFDTKKYKVVPPNNSFDCVWPIIVNNKNSSSINSTKSDIDPRIQGLNDWMNE